MAQAAGSAAKVNLPCPRPCAGTTLVEEYKVLDDLFFVNTPGNRDPNACDDGVLRAWVDNPLVCSCTNIVYIYRPDKQHSNAQAWSVPYCRILGEQQVTLIINGSRDVEGMEREAREAVQADGLIVEGEVLYYDAESNASAASDQLGALQGMKRKYEQFVSLAEPRPSDHAMRICQLLLDKDTASKAVHSIQQEQAKIAGHASIDLDAKLLDRLEVAAREVVDCQKRASEAQEEHDKWVLLTKVCMHADADVHLFMYQVIVYIWSLASVVA
jgi:hypothetical protein